MTGIAERQQKRLRQRALVRGVKLLDLVLLAAPFILAWIYFYSSRIASPFYRMGHFLVVALWIVGYYYIAHLYGGFQLHISRISELLYSQVMAAFFTDFFMYVVIWLLTKHIPNVLVMIGVLVFQIALAAFWCYAAHHWYFKTHAPKKTAVIWDEREGLDTLLQEYGLDIRYDIIATPYVDEVFEGDSVVLPEGTEVVILCDLHSHERNQIIKLCTARGIPAYVIPRIGDVLMSGAKKIHILHLPTLAVRRYDPTPEYAVIKRLFDVILSVIALIIMAIPMCITAIAIKAYDHGPVFYKQERLTKDGKHFNVIKFRSMRMDAEEDGVARLSTGEADPRITPVGRVIRKIRMDEWPQLFNIIKGDMSIVGPRPERPEIAEQYKETLPEFDLRLQCKAGLTGYAQVYGKYNTTPYDKLILDLMYINNPSIFEDVRIMMATLKILFLPESTEGVAEGSTTAADDNSADSE